MKLSLISFLSVSFLFILSQSNINRYVQISKENFEKYNPNRKDYVIVIDYSKNILQNRLFVIDMKNEKIVLNSRVSHGFKSGIFYSTDFSNKRESNKTSKGVYKTGGTKYGRFGYSMYVHGLDKGINDNAYSRNIIFHSTKLMKTPWSNGCFATSEDINKKIINLTKNGCLVIVLD